MFEKGVLKILKEDHDHVEKLLKGLGKSDDKNEQGQLVRELGTELLLHAKVEEELFYPELERVAQGKTQLLKRAEEEHHVAEKALKDLLAASPGTPEFQARLEVVKTLVLAHAKEEESALFPIAKKGLDKARLESIGERVETRKRTLRAEMTRTVVEKAA